MTALTEAEQLKFHLLEHGIQITPEAAAYIASVNGDRAMTPADYASTSGIILKLSGDVWVNTPIEDYNPNFVSNSEFCLRADQHGLWVEGKGLSTRAWFSAPAPVPRAVEQQWSRLQHPRLRPWRSSQGLTYRGMRVHLYVLRPAL